MEVTRLGVESELQLLATATATARQDPSHICKPSTKGKKSPRDKY